MDMLGRAALLSELLDRIRVYNDGAGPVHLQKCMFFLQEMRGVPAGLEFVLYRYGPYSDQLQAEIDTLRGTGVFDWVLRSPYATGLATTEVSREIRGDYPQLLESHEDDLAFVSDLIGPMRSRELVGVSTAFYYLVKGVENDKEAAYEVCQWKPHIDLSDALEAVRRLRGLAEQSGWRPRSEDAISQVA